MSNVNKSSCKISSFSRFKCCIGKTFTTAVVDIKYSKTVKPSLKFEIMGVSIISPTPPVSSFGVCHVRAYLQVVLPAVWNLLLGICHHKYRVETVSTFFKGSASSFLISSNIISATSSVTLVQMSIILL